MRWTVFSALGVILPQVLVKVPVIGDQKYFCHLTHAHFVARSWEDSPRKGISWTQLAFRQPSFSRLSSKPRCPITFGLCSFCSSFPQRSAEMAPGSKVGQELILLNHRSEHVVQLPTDETSRKHFLPPVHASLSQRDKGKADGLAPWRGKYPGTARPGQGHGDGEDF